MTACLLLQRITVIAVIRTRNHCKEKAWGSRETPFTDAYSRRKTPNSSCLFLDFHIGGHIGRAIYAEKGSGIIVTGEELKRFLALRVKLKTTTALECTEKH